MAVPEDSQVSFLSLSDLGFVVGTKLTLTLFLIFDVFLSLSTMHREFAGLKGMPYYDQMLSAVLHASSSPLVDPPKYTIGKAMDAYSVNEPQARAILGAMNPNTSGFVLIQG